MRFAFLVPSRQIRLRVGVTIQAQRDKGLIGTKHPGIGDQGSEIRLILTPDHWPPLCFVPLALSSLCAYLSS